MAKSDAKSKKGKQQGSAEAAKAPSSEKKKPKKKVSTTRASLGAGIAAILAVGLAVLGGAFFLHDSESSNEVITSARAASIEYDQEGPVEVYDYRNSFLPFWRYRGDPTDPCWRTDEWHGVPFSVEKADDDELDIDALTSHLLEKEVEWMQLPIRDWKDEKGSAYNTTSARYDQYNVLADADMVPVVAQLKRFIKRSARNYLSCVASSPRYFDSTNKAGEYFHQILAAIPPLPLYIMCWVNVFRADRKHANALHWHLHNWPFQGYLSVTSEDSGTLFRSNVEPQHRWRFDHKHGLLFILPGGTLHSSTPWKKMEAPRITVAFNLAPPQNARPHEPAFFNRWTWVELFSAEELQQLRYQGERWAMITRRPPNRYTVCMVDGDCPPQAQQ